jgi:hypothetical protein
MPIKGGDAEMREIDRWDGGAGWIAHPDEAMERASHALAVDGDVWVLDPVDADGVDDLLSDLGEVVGVVVCLDRHERDAAAVARRHDVPVYVPDWMSGLAGELDAETERFGRSLGDTGYRAITVRDSGLPRWQELGLYREEDGTLVVPEAVGTAEFFRAGDERLGVHPALRLFPPRRTLGGLSPERILVGHGEGVFDDAATALRRALDGSRRNAPGLYGKQLRMFVSG